MDCLKSTLSERQDDGGARSKPYLMPRPETNEAKKKHADLKLKSSADKILRYNILKYHALSFEPFPVLHS